MPVSPSSSAQAAREAVAGRLRDLRKEAGLTITELASRCGWHHSKTSRIENAITGPTANDIRQWCAAIGAQSQAQDIIVQSVNAESMYREWRHQIRRGLTKLQENTGKLFRTTNHFRVYSSTLVPGLLQTEGYATSVLSATARFRELPADDSTEAARARVDRSRVIHDPGRRFALLIEESVLRCQIADIDAMAAQLGYLLTAGAIPTVSLGIIPAAARLRSQWPRETFHVYDDKLVSVEMVSARVRINQPSEVALYVKAFEQLRGMAVYGAEARALILKAIEALH
ncbi:helix-turn-helix transcriptional regulator [Streptomyces sp. 110]|uniref:Helix-turn-helix transcriptional regulator n=1 Tax=Streptomyces endocoffeicus TaxID=2898945 RepID=A0ABS1PPV1_9ACTN|nr:helix-turn-helix transcriptional regulator [Streptomyces endocoffeicus]MBL1114432.1 helix-turn-helix transcriptional regulator [Streptomyces endocoffeicus]